jgi:hypothetical protein
MRVLKDNFEIIKPESKSNGYNAIYFDAKLNKVRKELPEYDQLPDLVFEIQITTILQHCWSELEHDRAYKLDSVLPTPLLDTFRSISETFVKYDYELEQATRKIDDYVDCIKKKIDNSELDLPLDSPTLRQYILKEFGDIPDFKLQFGCTDDRKAIKEMYKMGINTIEDLKNIIPIDFKKRYVNLQKPLFGTFAIEIIRLLMIIHDWKRYLTDAYDGESVFNEHDFMVLAEFGVDIVELAARVKKRWD